jgi:amino acid transporter
MMGAGLYTLVGLASTTAGVWVPLAFLVGGVVTVFSVYSYAKLGARYPSRGGAAHFLIRCFGDGVVAGGLNVFQFLGWDHRDGAVLCRLRRICPGVTALAHPGLGQAAISVAVATTMIVDARACKREQTCFIGFNLIARRV